MTLTLLLDLDNTLLSNNMDTFLPAYLQGLASCLAPYAEPDRMLKALMSATRRMIENNDPARSLKEVFDANFYPALRLDPSTVQAALDHFYKHEYTFLRPLTRQRPEAREIIEFALQNSYRIAVATNPLFSATAIYQRVEWAGLPPDQIPFDHITTSENSHFAKPNPAYYTEILAHLGWPEGSVLMVGDDVERDILPANALGLSTYWIHENGIPNGGGGPSPTASGPLDALLPWLKKTDPARLLPAYNYNSPDAIVATLRATPAAIDTQLQSLPELKWRSNPNPDDWNLTEIVCHMRDTEEIVNLPRLRQVLLENNPFLPGVDTDSWAENGDYFHENGLSAFRTFCQIRAQTLTLLENISHDDWQRPARHAIFGPTTFREIAHFITEHDRLHIRQIQQYVDRIGR